MPERADVGHPGATQPPPVGDPTTDLTSGPQNGAERDEMALIVHGARCNEPPCLKPGIRDRVAAEALIAAGFGDVRRQSPRFAEDEMRAERDALAAQVSAVEAVHHPMTTSSGQWCSHDVKDWPCPTIAAIKRAGQIATHCVGIAFDGSPFCFGCDDWPCPAIERAGQDPT